MNDERNGRENDERKMLTYRILRYVPNLVRDEWVNIGVLLEDGPSARRAIKLIEEDSEFARVRRLNPAMDDSLLRGLAGTFDAELRKSNETGDEVGVLFVNPDQIVAISSGPSATELQMSDGRTRWVKDTPDQVVVLAKAST